MILHLEILEDKTFVMHSALFSMNSCKKSWFKGTRTSMYMFHLVVINMKCALCGENEVLKASAQDMKYYNIAIC